MMALLQWLKETFFVSPSMNFVLLNIVLIDGEIVAKKDVVSARHNLSIIQDDFDVVWGATVDHDQHVRDKAFSVTHDTCHPQSSVFVFLVIPFKLKFVYLR